MLQFTTNASGDDALINAHHPCRSALAFELRDRFVRAEVELLNGRGWHTSRTRLLASESTA